MSLADRGYSPDAVQGAARIIAALAEVPDAARLDALALASMAFIEKPDCIPAMPSEPRVEASLREPT